MQKLVCQYCGKVFYGHGNRKHCSRHCANLAHQFKFVDDGRKMPPSTLCWKCKNTNAIDCSWFSKKEEPVPGWIATPTVIRYISKCKKDYNCDKESSSYIVHECPNFEPDRR